MKWSKIEVKTLKQVYAKGKKKNIFDVCHNFCKFGTSSN